MAVSQTGCNTHLPLVRNHAGCELQRVIEEAIYMTSKAIRSCIQLYTKMKKKKLFRKIIGDAGLPFPLILLHKPTILHGDY